MRIRIALSVGLLLVALAIVVVLSRSPETLAGTNGVPLSGNVATTRHDTRVCQFGETLPRGTSALRLGLFTLLGPRLTVTVFEYSHLVTWGTRSAGWDATEIVVPLAPVPHAVSPATICVQLNAVDSEVSLVGDYMPRGPATIFPGTALHGRMRIEYLTPGRTPWGSLVGTIVKNIGFGHALTGTWDFLCVMALAALIVILSSWLVVRELQ